MTRRRIRINRLAAFVATFIAFVVPNTSLAQGLTDFNLGLGTMMHSLGLAGGRVHGLARLRPKLCECKKIAPRICNIDEACNIRIGLVTEPTPPMKILETGFSLLKDIGGEEPGYGLYSYALAVNNNNRSARFLGEVLSAIPPVVHTAAQRSRINILHTIEG